MSHQEYISEKLSHRLPSLLPEHLREESPALEQFLRAYFEFLEAEILVLESQSDLDGVALEDGQGSLLLETATVSPSPDQDTSKVINERSATNTKSYADPFIVGEYIYGKTNGAVSRIDVINGNILYVKAVSGNGYSPKEVVEGRDGGQTAIVKSYKENTITASNRLLDYSDIDHTTEDFLDYFQKDFVPSLDLRNVVNKRLTIKNIKDLYKKKGTQESVQFLMRLLFGQDAEIRYPDNETMYLSDSNYNQRRSLAVRMTSGIPSATDKITEYYDDTNRRIVTAQANVENVYAIDTNSGIYYCDITQNHYGEFTIGKDVSFLDRDEITEYRGEILGIISDFDKGTESSSIFISHDDDGIITLESGLAASYDGDYEPHKPNLETTVGGALTLEYNRSGSMYSINDKLNFKGAVDNTRDADESLTVISALLSGTVDEIYIEDGGLNYEGGEMVVFEEDGTEGNGAEGIIGSTGDEIVLENATYWGQFEIHAETNGQTLFGGPGVKDVNGRYIVFNDNQIDVYVDGVLQVKSAYTSQNDRVTFTSGLNAGQIVEIYTQYNRLLNENGSVINYDGYIDSATNTLVSNDGRIRSIQINDGGVGFTKPPRVYPGGYIYFDDITGFEVGEQVEGTTSGATATIIKLQPKEKRVLVKRESTDTGVFQNGEEIVGQTSNTQKINRRQTVATGTGAKLFVWSDSIGGVGTINVQSQGYDFDKDAQLSETSHFNMLITAPTANLTRDLTITGDISGTTGKVVSYDSNTHVLTYTQLDGYFLDNETVSFNIVDEFTVLRSNPFFGRGVHAGEGIIQKQLLGDRGILDADAVNLQDGLYYQTHSYVIRVGESINKYRSIVKDLIHPAGHIFFGEVAIKNVIDDAQVVSTFRPTIIIKLHPTWRYELENASRDLYTSFAERDDESHIIFEQGGYPLLEDGPDMKAVTVHEHILFLHLDDGGVGHDLKSILRAAGIPDAETDPRTGLAITNTVYDTTNVTNPAGAASGRDTEVGDSSMRSRHLNINIINSFAHTYTQGSPRIDGATSVLNLVRADNNYLALGTDDADNISWPYTKRPSDQGKVFQISDAFTEEHLIHEDGSHIILEEEACLLRFEPSAHAIHKGDYGDNILSEDGETLLRLETATTEEEIDFFVTERSIELTGKHLYYEDGINIITEEGDYIIREESGANHSTSFVPMGSTLRTINTISSQNAYDIAYYLKDETDGDDILLEDGYGNLLSEESKSEGLRIHQLDAFYPNFFIAEYDNHARRRTNLTFSAYVKSA